MSRLLAWASSRIRGFAAFRLPSWRSGRTADIARRLVHFWVVWSALLLIHEFGHAYSGWRQGMTARRVTVGVGPVVWDGRVGGTDAVLRLVPVAGVTSFAQPRTPAGDAAVASDHGDVATWSAWRSDLVTIAGGSVATLGIAALMMLLVVARERSTGRRWLWGRFVVADAVVLTVFNFLPVPPLDGGRAVIGAVAAWRGAPLAADTLQLVQVTGLLLAVAPMALWTRWTGRIDAAALRWGAPLPA